VKPSNRSGMMPLDLSRSSISKRSITIGLLGLGTVGSEVYNALIHNAKSLSEKTGFIYEIKKILVKNPEKSRAVNPKRSLLFTKIDEILEDPEIELIVEVMGGLDPAGAIIEKALCHGKSVVTANKGVMATHGERLLKLAEEHKADLFFEASVAGAIPILRPLQESMATDRILEVCGIVNGTTNFILTKMTQEGSSYETALKEAQRLGYAEPDPTFDVTGMDAAYKIAILAALAFGHFAKGDHVSREGITEITPTDLQHAKEMGYRVKLLAKATCDSEGLLLSVAPTWIPSHHPLYNVEGPYNAILVKGERLGDVMFYGQGAGGVPTSTAVVSDIVHASKNIVLGISGQSNQRMETDIKLKSPESFKTRYFFRLSVDDKPGTLAALAKNFADEDVSFAAVLQKENTVNVTDILFLTHDVREGAFRKALANAKKLPFVKSICSVFKVEP